MYELFRYLLVRSPEATSQRGIQVHETPFLEALRAAVREEQPRLALKRSAHEFVEGGRFLTTASGDRTGRRLLELHDRISKIRKRVSLEQLTQAVGDVAWLDEMGSDYAARLSDSVLAIKLLPEEHRRPIDELGRALQAMHFVERLQAGDKSLAEHEGRLAALDAMIVVPEWLLPIPTVPLEFAPEREAAEEPPPRLADDRITRMHVAIDELRNAALLGLRSLDQGDNRAVTLSLSGEGYAALSDRTRDTLRELDLDPRYLPLDRVMTSLENHARLAVAEAAEPDPVGRRTSFLGSTPVRGGGTEVRYLASTATGAASFSSPFGLIISAFKAGVPTTYGKVTSVGWAQLMLVKQRIKRYEAGEVAHIENVLRGERRVRNHTRSHVVDEFESFETESQVEDERHLETTDRFELKREVAESNKKDLDFGTSLRLHGKLGPALNYDSNTKFGYKNSKQNSRKLATSYAKETVQRSVDKVSERIKRAETKRVVTSVAEENKHQLDNRGSSSHISGVYQWVVKIYEAQIYQYDWREMYDITVPEPAAWLIAAAKAGAPDQESLIEPEPFTLRPEEIFITDYGKYVQRYGATDVAPPPQNFIAVAKAFHGDFSGSMEGGGAANSLVLDVPEGYRAIRAKLTAAAHHYDHKGDQIWGGHSPMSVSFADDVRRVLTPGEWTVSLRSVEGGIPMAFYPLQGIQKEDSIRYTVTVTVECVATGRAIAKWQSETHTAILQAYSARKAEYDEELARRAAERRASGEIEGRNPAANESLMKAEIKKACIATISAQHFDKFDAIDLGGDLLPQIDFTEAEVEGAYVRFFEQAFEWEHLAFALYPYFWGRKETWVEKIAIDDVDPVFSEFLKAGSARVQVPARRGFERMIAHFLQTGEVWGGGPVPGVGTPDDLPLHEERSAQLGKPDDGEPFDDPWEVRVPTRLVRLRPDGSLPSWQNREGAWVGDAITMGAADAVGFASTLEQPAPPTPPDDE